MPSFKCKSPPPPSFHLDLTKAPFNLLQELTRCRDWKKLTFYYFADSYINFNSLVTDLFKIYKTRIWMSAINPASFASPTLGIQAPSGIGPGAVGAGRASGSGERRQQNQPAQEQPAQSFAQPPPAARGFRSAFPQPFGGDRQAPPTTAYPSTANYAYGGGAAFGNARSNPYATSPSPGLDSFSGTAHQQPGDTRQRFAGAQTLPSPAPHAQGVSPISPQSDWTGAFQGLSLNTH